MQNIILLITVSILIAVASLSFDKWRCNRMGMDFDYLGCIARK